MPPVHMLIKPASGLCNMRCQYCFYADVTDNLQVQSYNLETIEQKRKKIGFLEESRPVADACGGCRWYPLCRGGCRRDREEPDGTLGLNYYCTAYQDFFAHSYDRLCVVAKSVANRQQAYTT